MELFVGLKRIAQRPELPVAQVIEIDMEEEGGFRGKRLDFDMVLDLVAPVLQLLLFPIVSGTLVL